MVNPNELGKGQKVWYVGKCSDYRFGGEDNLNYQSVSVESVFLERKSESLLDASTYQDTFNICVSGVNFFGSSYVEEKDLYYTEQEAKEAAIKIVKDDIEWHTKQLNRRTDLLKRLGGVN